MASRYSGSVGIKINIVKAPAMPHGEQYKVQFVKGKKSHRSSFAVEDVYVGMPRHLERAIDSPQAYDEAARAGVAFLLDKEETEFSESDFDWSESGVAIRRQQENKSPYSVHLVKQGQETTEGKHHALEDAVEEAKEAHHASHGLLAIVRDASGNEVWSSRAAEANKKRQREERFNKERHENPAPRSVPEADETAAEELILFADNESSLYPQKKAILANLLRKKRAGKYDASLAPKLWMYWLDNAAKLYAKEHGSSPREWNTMFTKATRMHAAKEMAERENANLDAGEHDYLLDKGERRGNPAEGEKNPNQGTLRWTPPEGVSHEFLDMEVNERLPDGVGYERRGNVRVYFLVKGASPREPLWKNKPKFEIVQIMLEDAVSARKELDEYMAKRRGVGSRDPGGK